jgi:tRNA(fMet)-specific endonuclease VapC
MEVICLDTNILIEFWRAKKDVKDKTKLVLLSSKYQFAVSVIVAFELFRGDNSKEDVFWKSFFSQVIILDMDLDCAEIAGTIYKDLKQKGSLIGMEDILIASIALKHNFKLATDNTKHFDRIHGLTIV